MPMIPLNSYAQAAVGEWLIGEAENEDGERQPAQFAARAAEVAGIVDGWMAAAQPPQNEGPEEPCAPVDSQRQHQEAHRFADRAVARREEGVQRSEEHHV